MRTTLDIEDDVLNAARALSVAKGVSVGAALPDLVRRGIAARTPLSTRNGFPVFHVLGNAGFRSGRGCGSGPAKWASVQRLYAHHIAPPSEDTWHGGATQGFPRCLPAMAFRSARSQGLTLDSAGPFVSIISVFL